MCGPIWRGCARVPGYRDDTTPEAVADLGAAIELAAQVQDLRAETARGRIRIPQDTLARHGVSAAALLERESPARLRDMFAEHCERIGADIAHGLARVPAVDRRAQQSVLSSPRSSSPPSPRSGAMATGSPTIASPSPRCASSGSPGVPAAG